MLSKRRNILSFILALALVFSMLPAMPAMAAVVSYTEAPQNLRVPPLAYDEAKIVVMWDKPADYYESQSAIVDYEVFINDSSVGLASVNFAANYTYVNAYIEGFYDTLSNDHYKINTLSYTATGLEPETDYSFAVRAVYADGNVSELSDELSAATAAVPFVVNAADYGAAYVESVAGDYSIRRANNNQAIIDKIEANTAAIQAAIDATPAGGKVVLKGSGSNATPYYYVSGSLFLHSNMTIEIEEGAVLFGSPVFDHYPRSLLVYPYSQDIRTYGLLNAVSWDHGTLENIRIVGKGAVNGNGWKNVTTNNGYQEKGPVDPSPAFVDPTGNEWNLPRYQAGSNSTVDRNQVGDAANVLGILAADAMWQSRQDATPNSGTSQHYNTRPNLTVTRGVTGLYYEGLTFYNPAFHGIVNYQSEEITCNGVIGLMYDTNNGDGIEFGDCLDLTVMNSFWDTGDDAINFASGQGTSVRNLSDRVATGEGRVFNNFVRNSHGGFLALGSHVGGFIGDLIAEENIACSNETGTNGILRLKAGSTTGGGIRNIVVRDNAVHYVAGGNRTIVIDTSYSDGNASTAFGPESDHPLVFENVLVRNLTISNSRVPVMNVGAPGTAAVAPTPIVRNFTFEDIDILSYTTAGGNISINGMEDVTFRNISGLRNAITVTNSKNVTIENCEGTPDRTPDSLNWAGAVSASASGNMVTVSWPEVTGAASYDVLVDMQDGYGYQKKETVTDATTTTFALRPETAYKIAVRPESTGTGAAKGDFAETEVTTGAAVLGESGITIGNKALGMTAPSGISWKDVRWGNATDATYGIHYYELTAEPKDRSRETKSFKAYFDRPARAGYALWGLDDGEEYTVSVSAVNWVGQKEAYNSADFTTVPNTLMQIPQWDNDSTLVATEATYVGDEIILTWNESDVTDYSNGDTARFAGYRIMVNGVPVNGGAIQANATNTVAPGTNTYTLSTEKLLPNIPYVISVEAGSEILKYASGSGGLSGSTGFTGVNNTGLARNQVTFGKWTGHGPSIEITLAENEDFTDGKARVKLNGPTAVKVEETEVEYILSAANLNKLATITLWIEADGKYFEGKDVIGLNGFQTLGNIDWVNTSDTMWSGRVTLGAFNSESSVTSSEYVDLLKLTFRVRNELGSTSIKITRIDLSGYDENNKAVFIDSLIRKDSVATDVVENFSPYDVNRDGKVDQLDLTTAQLYYAAKDEDDDWDDAKIADVNADGRVDIEDFILILNNIVW